jgi:hypothetical protein
LNSLCTAGSLFIKYIICTAFYNQTHGSPLYASGCRSHPSEFEQYTHFKRSEKLQSTHHSLSSNTEQICEEGTLQLQSLFWPHPHICQTLCQAFVAVLHSSAERIGELQGVAVELPTRWAKEVTAEHVWSEYPRPQLRRQQWGNLNGYWEIQVPPPPPPLPRIFCVGIAQVDCRTKATTRDCFSWPSASGMWHPVGFRAASIVITRLKCSALTFA